LFIALIVLGALSFIGILGCCFTCYSRRRERRMVSQAHIATGWPHEFEDPSITRQHAQREIAAQVQRHLHGPSAQPAQHQLQEYHTPNVPPGVHTPNAESTHLQQPASQDWRGLEGRARSSTPLRR
jgi:hypothetical protein